MTTAFITLAGLLGVPVLGFMIFLLKRAPELAQSSATTDATLIGSAGAVVKILQDQNALQENQIKALNERLLNNESARVADQVSANEQLRAAHAESERTNAIIAKLTTDLDVTKRLVDELQRHLPSDIQVSLVDPDKDKP